MCIAKVWLLQRVFEENRVYVSGMGEIPKSVHNSLTLGDDRKPQNKNASLFFFEGSCLKHYIYINDLLYEYFNMLSECGFH